MKLIDQLRIKFIQTLTPLENELHGWIDGTHVDYFDADKNVIYADELEGAFQEWLANRKLVLLDNKPS